MSEGNEKPLPARVLVDAGLLAGTRLCKDLPGIAGGFQRLLGLAKRATAVRLVLLQSRRHALDGHHALQFGVLCLIDLPHAAGAEQLRNYKPARDGSGKYRDATRR